MHRHGSRGRKFGRERDQRTALMKGLADSLILHESIETTVDKAKELRPYVEKLVTKARKGGLHNRRQIISSVHTLEAAHKLVDSIAPMLQRDSGYLRIVKTTTRRGDNTQMARISFVDDLHVTPVAKAAEKAADVKPSKSTLPAKQATKKTVKATTKKGTK